jgi:hypothetical protein
MHSGAPSAYTLAYPAVLTIVHLNGTPILSLYSTAELKRPILNIRVSKAYFQYLLVVLTFLVLNAFMLLKVGDTF